MEDDSQIDQTINKWTALNYNEQSRTIKIDSLMNRETSVCEAVIIMVSCCSYSLRRSSNQVGTVNDVLHRVNDCSSYICLQGIRINNSEHRIIQSLEIAIELRIVHVLLQSASDKCECLLRDLLRCWRWTESSYSNVARGDDARHGGCCGETAAVVKVVEVEEGDL